MDPSFLLFFAIIAFIVIAVIASRRRRRQPGESDRHQSRFDTETRDRAAEDVDPAGVGWLAVLAAGATAERGDVVVGEAHADRPCEQLRARYTGPSSRASA
jgi:hypothetical protein